MVKRFWAEGLRPIARLYAHPRFVPTALRASYKACTSMPIFDPQQRPDESFGLLLDPNTGIELPTEGSTGASQSHVSLPFIREFFQQAKPLFVVCFDQSYHRRHELTREGQRDRKR